MSIIDRAVDRIKMMLVKALITAVVDTEQIQLVKLSGLSGEHQDGVERLQNYGLTSNPPVGSEAVVAYLGGNRDHGVVIVCDSGTWRVTGLVSGEVAIYSQFGQKILLKEDSSVEITASGGVSVGAGSDSVAMAVKVELMWTTLLTALKAWTGTKTPDGGVALAAALVTAFSTAGLDPPNVASTNLKAD